jgi:hypothetical protein
VDGDPVAILVVEKDLRLPGLAVFDGFLQGAPVLAKKSAVAVDVFEEVVVAEVVHHLVASEPGEPFRSAVPEEDAPFGVDEVDPVVNLFQ